MNLATVDGQAEVVSLPLGDGEPKGVLTLYLPRNTYDRLIQIMAQAFDPEEMAKAVGKFLLENALMAAQSAAADIVDELPLGQFRGWNAPGHGGPDGSTPPAA